jgi:hypothetical protein
MSEENASIIFKIISNCLIRPSTNVLERLRQIPMIHRNLENEKYKNVRGNTKYKDFTFTFTNEALGKKLPLSNY